jgi:sugar/nucleoside kinase (ribokinase family)
MMAATVIGDLFYDYVCDLSLSEDLPATLGHADFDAVADIAGLVGGGAVQFAIAAVQEGFAPVTVIGKVGSSGDGALDPAGATASCALQQAGIEPLLARDRNIGTGEAIIVYLPNDHRFMVSKVGANATFDVSDIDDHMLRAITRGGLLHVSGYALVHPVRRRATIELIKVAESGGATIAMDVVPHDIDRLVSPVAIRTALNSADWIISSEATARRLFGADRAESEQTWLTDLGKVASTVALFHHPSRASVICGEIRRQHQLDYIPGASSRGQSARSQAQLLARYLLSEAER